MDRYKRCPDNIASKIQNEIVMVNITLGNYFSMNEVASDIWELLEKERTIDEICDELQQNYDIDRESCEKEVTQFLNELLDQNLIEKS